MAIVKLGIPISTPYKNKHKDMMKRYVMKAYLSADDISIYLLYQESKEITLNFAACARSGSQAFISRVDIDVAGS